MATVIGGERRRLLAQIRTRFRLCLGAVFAVLTVGLAVTAKRTHLPGQVIGGRYELKSVAGKGGMATVWRAELRGAGRFRRTVAIKQMHEHLADKELYVDMFQEEARIGACVADSNIAQVYDFICEQGQYYLIMEWIDGTDLGTVIHYFRDRGQRTQWELVAAAGIGILRGLAAAHHRLGEAGEREAIVHRDVSPHNILLGTDGMVKLIDFGLSLASDRTEELTEPGIVKGKMSYLAPEILAGQRPSPATDQFAVGSVLWEALVGRKLFDGNNDLEVYAKLRNVQVQPLRPLRRDIPKDFVQVINKSLSGNEQDRFESVSEMATRLGQVLKSSRLAKDLRAYLGRTVHDARRFAEVNGAGKRDNSASVTPIAELEANSAATVIQRPDTTNRKGLLHRLPFFGRRR